MRCLRAAALLAAAACAGAQNIYDACNYNDAHGLVAKSDGGVPIGLAFWINGKLADWDPVTITTSNTTVTTDGAYENVTTTRSLHPCNDAAELAAIATPAGVVSTTPANATEPAPSIWKAVYRPTTDKMFIMHTDVTQMYQLLDYYTAYHANDTIIMTYENITGAPPSPPGTGGFLGLAPPPPPPNGTVYNRTYYNVSLPANNTATFMSVVAYYGHGANAVRSAPRYIFSEDKDLTGGTGVTTQLILVARFNAGRLAYLQWSELGCSGCGGPKDPQCMQVVTCRDYYNKTVTSVDNTTNVTSTTSSTYSLCGSGVYTGFSGTDRYGKPLKTGGQIDMVRKYSVSKLSSRALSYAQLAKAYVKEQVPTVTVASGSVNSR